jgi:hypothetical protein
VAQLCRHAPSHRQKKAFERTPGCHALVLQQDMVQDVVVLQLQPRRAGEPVNLVAGVRLSAIPDWDAERLQPLKEVVFPRRGPQLDLSFAKILSAREINSLQIFLRPSSCYKSRSCFASFGSGSERWLASFAPGRDSPWRILLCVSN